MENIDQMKQVKVEVMNLVSREFSDDIASMDEQRSGVLEVFCAKSFRKYAS